MPTSATTFGSTLTSLLDETSTIRSTESNTAVRPEKRLKLKPKVTPSNQILSLSHTKPPPSRGAVSLERKAARQLKLEKEEKIDKARVRDVLEGWVGTDGKGSQEFERGLRKVAQKGGMLTLSFCQGLSTDWVRVLVIKLFNAILVASRSAEEGLGSLSTKAGVKEEVGRKKERENLLGRGGRQAKEGALTQEGFLDLVRKG